MNRKQIKISTGVIAAVFLIWMISLFVFSSRETSPPLTGTPLAFDASRAYQATEEFVTRHPRRVLGSLESRQSTGYLQEFLERWGYETIYSHFDARIEGRKQVGRNVYAHKKGQSQEILAIIAHFDTAGTTEQGAAKNGAAVGVLLELARLFASSPTQRSFLWILSDGAEWGALGAQDLINSYPDKSRIVAAVSLDQVAPGSLAAFRLDETGQLKGFSPPWLRALARRAAEAQGLPVLEPSGAREHYERALLVSWADQGPLLRAGIPAINLGSGSADRALQESVYHSPQDTLENLEAGSIEKFGLVAERILRSLDELESIPNQSMACFRLWDSLFLKPEAVAILHALLFAPLPVILCFHLKNHFAKLNPIRAGREALALLGTLLPFLAIYFSIGLFRALRLIPLYSLYPATAGDPVLENPPLGVLGGILGIALFVAIACYAIAKFSFRSMPEPDFHVSKTVLMGILMILAAFAWARNSYWASAFLSLPAWIWALTGFGRNTGERWRNRVCILAAGIPGGLALHAFASRLGLGWNLVWYQTLALSTGLFTAAGYFVAAAALAIGIRFLVIQKHGVTQRITG